VDEFGSNRPLDSFERNEGPLLGGPTSQNLSAQRFEGIASRDEGFLKPSSSVSLTKEDRSDSFYCDALRVLCTVTPAIFILNSQRKVLFANHDANEMLILGDIVSLDRKNQIFCQDPVAQCFILKNMGNQLSTNKHLFSTEDGSFLIPKKDGWPIAVLVGADQLRLKKFTENGCDPDEHVTLLIRGSGGKHSEQSRRLKRKFGLNETEIIF